MIFSKRHRGQDTSASSLGRQWALVLCGLAIVSGPGMARAQDFVIGGSLSKGEIEQLRKAAAEGKLADKRLGELAAREVKLDVGTFFPFKFGAANQLWLWSDESICKRVDVPAKTPFALWGVVNGDADKMPSLHQYPAQDQPWGNLIGAKEGVTQVTVISNGDNGGPPVILDRLTIVVGQPPPTPGPGPNPPPGPGPVPIPATGLRVLVVVESADMSKLPAAQINALRAQEVRDYLNTHCVKVGNTPEWRMLDKDTPMQNESVIWQEAMKRPRTSLPWVLVSDGKTGFEGPLPANKDEFLKLLKQYGGP